MRGHRALPYVIVAITCVIFAINVLFLIWLIAGGAGGAATDAQDDCSIGTTAQVWSDCRLRPPTVVVVSTISRWVLVDVILGAVWLNLQLLRRSSDRADLQATSL
jgi:hypothetical protein